MAEQAASRPVIDLFNILRKKVSGKTDVLYDRELKKITLQELHDTVHDAWLEWQNALQNFENAECKDMVDYYSYRIKASQIRYEYLLRKAKALQLQ